MGDGRANHPAGSPITQQCRVMASKHLPGDLPRFRPLKHHEKYAALRQKAEHVKQVGLNYSMS